MEWKIEIRNKKGVFDPLASGIKKDIKNLGIEKVKTSQVFTILGG